MKVPSKSKTKSESYFWFHKFLPYIFLSLVAFLPLVPLLHPGLPITHDGKDHVARIANFYTDLQQGNIIPRWAGNLNWGYGHPILMFLYPLPSYVASLFHFLGFSLIDSVKILFGLSFVFSGFTMYLWVERFTNKYAGFSAAILYMFAPYRFVDLYVRGALGEHVAFIFPPLVLYFLLKLSVKRNFTVVSLGAFSLAGMLLSHNAISIMFLPIICLYAVFLFFQTQERGRFAFSFVSLLTLGFALASFFLMPALLEGKYTLRDIVTDKDYASRFVPFMDFVYGQWSFGGTNFLSKQVGILQWVCMFFSLGFAVYWYRKKNFLWQLALGSFFMFCASLFIMTSSSKIVWDNVRFLKNFQFPWRFLTVAVFTTAFSSGLIVMGVREKLRLIMLIVIVASTLLLTKPYWGINGYLYKTDTFFTDVYEGTTDTGESSPIWSVRFMEKRPVAHMEVINGKGKITELKRTNINHVYTIRTDTKVRLRENTLYFPGWNVFVDGKIVPAEFQDYYNRGLMTFYVEKGTHNIRIEFSNTKVRTFANVVSLFSLVIVGYFCIIRTRRLWHFQ